MKDERGFTVVELVTSFALVSIVLLVLFNIVFILKNIYTRNNNQTKLVLEQSLLSKNLNEDFGDGKFISYKNITNGYQFTFSADGITKYYGCLTYDSTNKTIIYQRTDSVNGNSCTGNTISNYRYKLFANSYVKETPITVRNITTEGIGTYNSIFILELPIYSNAYKDTNFGVTVRYLYNKNLGNISI